MTVYIFRIEKTEVLTYEYDLADSEHFKDTADKLVDQLKHEDPNATYYVQVNKKFPKNADWISRMPIQFNDTLPDGASVSIELSSLERSIIQRTHTSKLTDPQREKLNKPVYYIPADVKGAAGEYLQSPVELYNTNMLFKQFADDKIKAMVAHSAPNGKIVNAISAYENNQGWLAYQSHNFVPEPVKVIEKYTNTNLGYSPSIKKVDDAN